MRWVEWAAIAAAWAAPAWLALACSDAPTAATSRPNVLLVVLDTVRRDHLSTYGHHRETSPNLSRLAAAGTRYDDVLAPAPWTVPSHATLMTGQPPAVHGAHHEHMALGPELPTLAERFAAAGWQTAGFSANPFVGRTTKLDRGFDQFERIFDGGRAVTRAALDFIEQSPEPWFVFVNLMEAHMPYPGLPEDVRLRFMPGTPESVKYTAFEAQTDSHRYACGEKAPSPELIATIDALYDAALAHLDAILGELVDALEPVADDTIVVVVSDHGELLGEHGRVEHQWALLEPLLAVPLVVRAPGRLAAGGVVETPMGMRDVHDLVLELAGLPRDGERSRSATSPDSSSPGGAPVEAGRDVRVAEYYRPLRLLAGIGELDPVCAETLDRRMIAVHRGRWKLRWTSTGEPRLFDLQEDPGETTNVADTYPGVTASLVEEALARRRLAGAAPDAGAVPELDREERDRLRALGYLPGASEEAATVDDSRSK